MTHPEDIRRYRVSYEMREPIEQHAPPAQRQGVIYTLTTFAESGPERTVAVVTDFALADAWLRENDADLYETIYLFAVVEELYVDELYGGLGYGRRQFWYAWEPLARGFRPIETPDRYKSTCGFGVG